MMETSRKRRRRRKPGKLSVFVIILAALVVIVGAIGIVSLGGKIIGGLPGIKDKEEIINPLTGQTTDSFDR